jgi:capsular polysaccharide biosynthesis protein
MATNRPDEDPSTRDAGDDMARPRKGEVLKPNFGWDDSDKGRDTVAGRNWTIWDALKAYSPRNLVFALILGILAAAAGGAIAFKQPTVYSAQTQMIIDQPRAIAQAKDNGAILKLAVLKIKYADLAKSQGIAGQAAQALGLPIDRVNNNVVVTALPTDLLLSVAAQQSTAAAARRMSTAVSTAIITYADQEQAQLGIASGDRYNFSVVQASSAKKIQPTANKALQAAVGLGVLGFILAYVILQLIAPRPR